ncbi:hypothetical protein V495_02161 [Pseudogymnoascus sp. VKM F-4514 (FW-929)]|nr:hypothetical protein V495_02161 [Pseudogymnoascus sp. VKM F-4514 (FW-929)]KFY66573.1 hypothetical protein V497_00852 [Pseudogymnoascus sp. VKM F-4516 (FW-969)]
MHCECDNEVMASLRTGVVIKDLVFERELDTHRISPISESPYIRRLLDVIEPEDGAHQAPRKLVFEWLDTDLWKYRPYGKLSHPKLPQVLSKSILEALAVFQGLNAVHTGLLSSQPMLKSPFMEGVNGEQAMTLETRAPEVWKGLGVWPTSDVWSVGITVGLPVHTFLLSLTWHLARALADVQNPLWARRENNQGPHRRVVHGQADAAARALRYGSWGEADPKTGEMRPYIVGGTLEEELEKLPRELCSRECIEFILYLLELDYKKRPTALEALQHPFIKSTVTRQQQDLN